MKQKSKTSRWNQTANVLSIVCLLLLIFWEACEWILFLHANPHRTSCGYHKALDPLEMDITTCQYMPIWSAFCTVPFYLSQLVFIAIIRHALVVKDVVTQLLESISELRLENELKLKNDLYNHMHEFNQVQPNKRKLVTNSACSF